MNGKLILRVVQVVLGLGLLVFGLTGCSVVQLLTQPASATLQPPAASPTSPPPAPPSATPLLLQPAPTYTPLPTYTSLPTYTPLPSQTPWIITQPGAPVYVTPAQPPMIIPTPIPPQVGACCTLRVRNRSRHTYWIGAEMPYGGNTIHPNFYVEFYLPGPTWLQVKYCRVSDWGQHYPCDKINVYVDQVLEQVSIP